jgi:hypothetical protein
MRIERSKRKEMIMRVMNKFVFLFFIMLIIGCTNKKTQSNPKNEKDEPTNNLKTIDNDDLPEEGEEKLEYFGTIFISTINDDNINVRAYPSQKADVLFKVNKGTKILVTGTSREIDDIDGYRGNWLNIRVENQWGDNGWVFSKYVKNGRITTSELEIIPPVIEENRSTKLWAAYKVNGIITNFELYLEEKEEKQNFYTFAYGYPMSVFHYSNVPGTYIWYPETNELKHISYIGKDIESGWVKLTDDFKYLIVDYGSGYPPRGLKVWRVEDAKNLFSGMYYKNINLQGNTIDVIYRPYYWADKYDDEIKNYAEEYEKNNPVTDDELIIVCSLDLDTGIRKIIKGQYIHSP